MQSIARLNALGFQLIYEVVAHVERATFAGAIGQRSAHHLLAFAIYVQSGVASTRRLYYFKGQAPLLTHPHHFLVRNVLSKATDHIAI